RPARADCRPRWVPLRDCAVFDPTRLGVGRELEPRAARARTGRSGEVPGAPGARTIEQAGAAAPVGMQAVARLPSEFRLAGCGFRLPERDSSNGPFESAPPKPGRRLWRPGCVPQPRQGGRALLGLTRRRLCNVMPGAGRVNRAVRVRSAWNLAHSLDSSYPGSAAPFSQPEVAMVPSADSSLIVP